MKLIRSTVSEKLAIEPSGSCLLASVAIAVLAVAPIATIFAIVLPSSGDPWPHLLNHVLPFALHQTMLVLPGTAVLVITIGTGSAWSVTTFDVPPRRVFAGALLLPLGGIFERCRAFPDSLG